MKKLMSQKQLAANRRNAQKSTGPKSAVGKAWSRQNALKHGILSQEVLVRGQHLRESPREYEALRAEYCENLAPVGPVEAMLVDRIVTTHWRLRRALRAESGEAALSMDNGAWDRAHLEVSWLWFRWRMAGDVARGMQDTAVGCEYLIHTLEILQRCVRQEGELSEAGLARARELLGNGPSALLDKLTEFRERLVARPEDQPAEAWRATHREEVLARLDHELRSARAVAEPVFARAKVNEQSLQAAAAVPPPEVLDRLLRYETTLERQLYRAMHQLERLQRRRLGEAVPAPAVLEVASGC
jgi:hypothetical protein